MDARFPCNIDAKAICVDAGLVATELTFNRSGKNSRCLGYGLLI